MQEAAPTEADETTANALAFINRWQGVTASELSTAQSFVRELCDLLGVDVPHATPRQDYMFERPITLRHGDGTSSAGRIDAEQNPVATASHPAAPPWPSALPDQVRALAQMLSSHAGTLTLAEIEARFKGRGPWKKGLPRILDTLETLGRARREGDGWRG
ncbi:MAG: hypothetical protein ABI845_01560 [Polaromonas sp.]